MSDQPDYDFILNPAKPPKRPLLNGSSMKQRILVVAGALLVIIVLLTIGSKLLGASAAKNNEALIDLAAYQTAMKTIISTGSKKARDEALRNKAITAQYTLESDLQQTSGVLKKRRVAVPKDFASRYKASEAVTLLEEADKANNFDSAYTDVYNEKMAKYKEKLTEVFGNVSSADQTMVRAHLGHVKILLGETVSTP